MSARRTAVAFWGLWAACAPDAGPTDLEAPDVDRILVYFPVGRGGVVLGRAFPGTFSSNEAVPYAVIRSHPTSLRATVHRVDPDGGFDFSVVASGREVLEIAGSPDAQGEGVGPSVFVEVPPVPVPPATFRCCRNPGAPRGVCITEAEFEERLDPITEQPVGCPLDDPRPVSRCSVDRDCIVLSRRHYAIEADRLEVTRPGPEGRVTVSAGPGAVVANGLVLLENRRLRGIGRDEPAFRRSVIADDDGSFALEPIPARGDDELVLEVVDLNDFRSPTLSVFVEDAELESAQILEVWPHSDLSTQLGGFVGVRFWLTGVDGRGVCPDAPDADPAYCFSGGLTHEHVRIDRAFLDRPDQPVTLCPALAVDDPVPPEPPCGGPGVERLVAPTDRRGIEGDVRAGPEDIVLILDLSAASRDVPARAAYFAVLREWIARLRSRDRVGVISLGIESNSGILDRDAASERVQELSRLQPAGEREPFAGVAAAAQLLDDSRSARGRILLTSLGGPAALPDEDDPDNPYRLALDAVRAGRSADSGYPVDVVGVRLFEAPPDGGREAREILERLFESLAAFSGPVGRPGRSYGSVDNVLDLRLRLRDHGGQYAGGFNLLYELVRDPEGVDLSDTVGKLGELQIEATVTVPTGSAILRYEGPLEFQKLVAP